MKEHGGEILTLTNFENRAVLVPVVRIALTPSRGKPTDSLLGIAPIVIGSSPDCDLVTTGDPSVSRRHCELRLTHRGISVRDLGSKNGTFIGDIPVTEAILPLGATLTVGGSRVVASVEGSPAVVPLYGENRLGDAVGKSIVMRALFAQLQRAAITSETILLYGESGTGKEVLAKAIHAASPRSDKPFVVFDCSSVAPSVIEAELFGYARGAFTGAVTARMGLLEQADTGTLFIDELGELPLDLQPKLLRALEARQVRRVGSNDWLPFDARVIAATHRDLRTLVTKRSVREDLYYRLAVIEARVPPLRERKDDIPLLVETFLAARPSPRGLDTLPPHAMDLLLAHDWPGNVRELRNTVSRLLLFPEIAGSTLPRLMLGTPPASPSPGPQPSRPADPPETTAARDEDALSDLLKLPLFEARDLIVEQFERRYLAAKLRAHSGNISRLAEDIQASRQVVYRLLERYDLRGVGAEAARENRG